MIPRYILAAFAIDLAMGLIYLVEVLLGHPFGALTRFIDLDRERTLPTWFASVQLFCVAAALWAFAVRRVDRAKATSWLLVLLPIAFLTFSIDEVLQLHEYAGVVLDRFVLEGPRASTVVSKTGVWFILVGVPVIVALGLLIVAVRPYARKNPRAFLKLVFGTFVMLTGAIGLEGLSNLVAPESQVDSMLVLAEEMFELLGVTLALWGSYELARDSSLTNGHLSQDERA